MKKYIIERNIAGIEKLSPEEYKGAAATSNAALAKLAPRCSGSSPTWPADKTFCV